jgi:hypothetical protein
MPTSRKLRAPFTGAVDAHTYDDSEERRLRLRINQRCCGRFFSSSRLDCTDKNLVGTRRGHAGVSACRIPSVRRHSKRRWHAQRHVVNPKAGIWSRRDATAEVLKEIAVVEAARTRIS